MNKKLLLISLLILIVPTINALPICQEIITQDDIPCALVSTWQYDSCTSTTVKIYNSDPILLDQRNFTDYGITGRCNVTFNYTNVDEYIWNVSNGDSGHIQVQEGETMSGINIMWLIMALTIILFVIGLWKMDKNIIAFSGILSIIGGVYILINGFGNISNSIITDGIGVVIICFGAYIFIRSQMEDAMANLDHQ